MTDSTDPNTTNHRKEPTMYATVAAEVMNPDARWVPLSRAAALAGVSEWQAKQLIKQGRIVGQRVMGRIAVLEASARAYRDGPGR